MPVPTVYSEAALKSYMLVVTGNLGTVLGLSEGDFNEAVNDTLLAYDTSTIAGATDIAKLRALAKVQAWRVAKAKAAGKTDFTADGATFKRSQLMQQAQAGLEMAENEAISYGSYTGYAMTASGFVYVGDPYPLPAEEESA